MPVYHPGTAGDLNTQEGRCAHRVKKNGFLNPGSSALRGSSNSKGTETGRRGREVSLEGDRSSPCAYHGADFSSSKQTGLSENGGTPAREQEQLRSKTIKDEPTASKHARTWRKSSKNRASEKLQRQTIMIGPLRLGGEKRRACGWPPRLAAEQKDS